MKSKEKYLGKAAFILLIALSLGLTCKAQQITADTLQHLQMKIAGTWELENDSSTKFIFQESGILKRYYNGQLANSSDTYEITDNCGEETYSQSHSYYLKVHHLYSNGNESTSCFYIEAVENKTNGILSLITKEQGKVIVFRKSS